MLQVFHQIFQTFGWLALEMIKIGEQVKYTI